MGLFDDKKYENMDWISQAVEPIECDLIKTFSDFPDEIEFDYNIYRKYVSSSGLHSSITVEGVVPFLVKLLYNTKLNTWHETNLFSKCFAFEMSDTVEIDFENETFTGSLKLIKIKKSLEEKDLKPLMGAKGFDAIDPYAGNNYARAQEVAELLNCSQDVLKTKSVRNKVNGIRWRYQDIMQKNEWNIKDIELTNKVGLWISAYCETGNLAALKNLAKLKVMTHKGLPIYSIEEEL